MEYKMRCSHCGRCLGIYQSTSGKDGVCIISKTPQKEDPKGQTFHSTCQRCKNEIYVNARGDFETEKEKVLSYIKNTRELIRC